MYAPAIDELATPWTELEVEAEVRDWAAELLVDDFDIWDLSGLDIKGLNPCWTTTSAWGTAESGEDDGFR